MIEWLSDWHSKWPGAAATYAAKESFQRIRSSRDFSPFPFAKPKPGYIDGIKRQVLFLPLDRF